MFFLIILFAGINVISLIFSIIILFTSYNYYFSLFLFIYILTFLMSSILFYIKTNKYPLNDINDYSELDFKKITSNFIQNEIIFKYDSGNWICLNDENIILDLSGYLFQKSYLISYVIRNFRYKRISKKKSFTDLFKKKYFIKKDLNFWIVFIKNKKIIRKQIIVNGYSVYNFISIEITRAPFYKFYLSNTSRMSLKNCQMFIDEKRYKNFYVKIKK